MPPRNTFAATRRSHTILEWLQAGEDVTIQRICEEFDIQYPQARADLKLLEELYNLSTYRDGRTKVWKWSRVSPHITFATAAALEFGGIAMDIFHGTPYGEEIDRIAAYCKERVGRAQEGRLGRLTTALHLRRTWLPADQERMIDNVEVILDAFQMNKAIEIVYERAHDSKTRTYKIHPRSIIWYNGRLWLLARHDDQDKHFDIVGVQRVRILRKEVVQDMEELNIEEHFENAFGIFAGKDFPIQTTRIVVGGSWAAYFRRYRLHPSQELRELEDGKMEVTLTMAICPEFKSFLKSLVPYVHIVEPVELRDELYDQFRRWLNETAHLAALEAARRAEEERLAAIEAARRAEEEARKAAIEAARLAEEAEAAEADEASDGDTTDADNANASAEATDDPDAIADAQLDDAPTGEETADEETADASV